MEYTPGIKTSEFWGSVVFPWLLVLAAVILLGLGTISFEEALAIIGPVALGGGYAAGQYARSRAQVKGG